MNRFSFIIYFLLVSCISFAQSDLHLSPKHEVRAVWLTTIGGIDWPHSYAKSAFDIERQQKELKDILDKLKRAGINTVLLQTRIRGTVIYPSRYEPWDGCLSGNPGKSPGYDALLFAIDECHKRGMELHAWVVTIPVGKWTSAGCSQLRKRFGTLVTKIGQEGYLNPEKPQTADYLADICEEITRNYDVDGIHLDYIRYPETWKIRVSKQQGRQYITNIVRTISRRVKALKPWVKMSCSPVGKYNDLTRFNSSGWNAYSTVCQDAQGWLRDGLMDELFPMMYFQGNNFYPFAFDWAENSYGRIVAPGLGIYFMSPAEKNWPLSTITREMEVLRKANMGHTYFRSKFFTDNTKGLYTFAKDVFDHNPALIPPMTWMHATPPSAPTTITLDTLGQRISWSTPTANSTGSYLLYNLYASTAYPVDTDDPRNLVATRLQNNSVGNIPAGKYYFAVTTLDRFGNESKALQSHNLPTKKAPTLPAALLKCDGVFVELPDAYHDTDAKYVAVETMQGKIIATLIPQGNKVNVSRVPEGMYSLRSLHKKGNAHSLGYFQIRRSKNL